MNLSYNETSIDQDNSPSVEEYRAHAEHLKDIAYCIEGQVERQKNRKKYLDTLEGLFGKLVTYKKAFAEYDLGELALKRWKNYYYNEQVKL